jgi:hypothetical protein
MADKMKLSVRQNPKQTFRQRLTREAIFWGIPMVCLEFIGIPILGWGAVLLMAVPATLVGVLVGTAIEHFLVSSIAKTNQ